MRHGCFVVRPLALVLAAASMPTLAGADPAAPAPSVQAPCRTDRSNSAVDTPVVQQPTVEAPAAAAHPRSPPATAAPLQHPRQPTAPPAPQPRTAGCLPPSPQPRRLPRLLRLHPTPHPPTAEPAMRMPPAAPPARSACCSGSPPAEQAASDAAREAPARCPRPRQDRCAAAQASEAELGDGAALKAFYLARADAPLWIADGALNDRAVLAIAEIKKGRTTGGSMLTAFSLPEPLRRRPKTAWPTPN